MAKQKKTTIKDLIDRGKKQASSSTSIGIKIPSLVEQGNSSDALVYTVISVLDDGTNPDGTPSSGGKITYCLPPPIQILDLHSANWEGIPLAEKIARLNDVKAGKNPLVGAAESGIDFAKKLGQDVGNAVAGFLGAQSNTFGASGSTGADTILRAKIGGQDFYNLYSIGTSTSLNPNIEMAFRSANLRNIQLNFRLVPLDQKNANDMQQFLDKLKLMMYAKSDRRWATGYPSRFTVQVKTKNIGGGTWSDKTLFSMGRATKPDSTEKISCLLVDYQISYGEGGIYSGHYDGSPGIIDLNLTFQESALSTRETIQEEYNL